MSIANITALVQAKTALTSTKSYDAIYVGEFVVASITIPQFVKLVEPFTPFEMNLLLDYVQMSPLQVTEEIYTLKKQFTVSSLFSYFADEDTTKRFVGLLLFVMNANQKQEFGYYYYKNSSDLDTLIFFYDDGDDSDKRCPSRPVTKPYKW